MRSAAEYRRLFWPVMLFWIASDVLTKRWAEGALLPIPALPVWGDWIQLRLVHNQGAAFGLDLGPYSRWIFLVIALVAAGFLAWNCLFDPEWSTLPHQVAGALVAAGALGNALDRLRAAIGVTDFIDIGVGGTRFPTFNVADIGVTCGAIALGIIFWIEDARRSRADVAAQSPSSTTP